MYLLLWIYFDVNYIYLQIHHHHVDMLCFYKTLMTNMSSNIFNCCVYRAAADTLNDFTWTHCARGLFNTVWFKHVAADWAEISDTPTKQEKTHLKPRCTPFPGNMLFSSANVAKHRAPGEPELAPLPKTTPEVLIEYFKENLVPTLFFYSSTPLESLTWNMLYKYK